MRFPAVKLATGYGRSSIYGLIKRGLFPQPVKLAGGGAVAWKASEVAGWIAAQSAGDPDTGSAKKAAIASVAARRAKREKAVQP